MGGVVKSVGNVVSGIGGAVGGLLGGASDVLIGESPNASIQDRPLFTPEQQQLLNETLLPFLQSTPLNQVQAPPFPGAQGQQFTTPFSPLEQSVLDRLTQFSTSIDIGNIKRPSPGQMDLEHFSKLFPSRAPSAGATHIQNLLGGQGDIFNLDESSLAQFLEADPTDFDDFFNRTIAQPLLQQFDEEILPGISGRAATRGAVFGGEIIDSEGRATEDLLDTLGTERARIGFETREAALNRALSAAGLGEQIAQQQRQAQINAALGLEQIASQEFLGAQQARIGAAEAAARSEQQRRETELVALLQTLDAQGIPREIADRETELQFADFLRQEGTQDQRVNQILGALGLRPVENIATVTGGTQGLLPAFLAGGGLKL